MTDNFEDQLDAIRIALYEEIKHMSSAEAVALLNERGRKVAAEFGITVTESAGHDPAPDAKT
jgi:diaminopimelate decarboxylase